MKTKCGDGPALAMMITALFTAACFIALAGVGLWTHFDARFGLAAVAAGVSEIPFAVAFLYALWDKRKEKWDEA